MRIPEEREPPMPLLEDARNFRAAEPDQGPLTPFERAVLVPRLNRLHRALARNHRRGPRRAELEASVARCLEHGPDGLSRGELSFLARDSQSLENLHAGAWRAPDASHWGECIGRKNRESETGNG
ncbi:MAG: hypothetical protein H5U30_09925 [Marinobacter sp.]|nr:hypothetical protein [Marinobacter sp.]